MFVGVDIGSVSSKAVVADSNGRVIAFAKLPTLSNRAESGYAVYMRVLQAAGLKPEEIRYIVATGYGRRSLKEANKVLPEIICHARGTVSLFPEARTIIDIGGQDSKVIELDSMGRPTRFGMNDKCAAGTGRFLEVMAGVLGVDLNEMGQLALRSSAPCTISSVCTVFAESEIVSLLSENRAKEDIASGLNYAIARRVINMGLASQVKYLDRVVFSGGVARNAGLVMAVEDVLGKKVLVPDEPQITGALGAAIFAAQECHQT